MLYIKHMFLLQKNVVQTAHTLENYCADYTINEAQYWKGLRVKKSTLFKHTYCRGEHYPYCIGLVTFRPSLSRVHFTKHN